MLQETLKNNKKNYAIIMKDLMKEFRRSNTEKREEILKAKNTEGEIRNKEKWNKKQQKESLKVEKKRIQMLTTLFKWATKKAKKDVIEYLIRLQPEKVK